nr:hypothetical protein [Phytoactinopolyspora halophila]
MRLVVGHAPAVAAPPAHLRLVARSDVVGVDECFELFLLAPDPNTGVDGVDQNGADGGVCPASLVPVRVASWVVLRRGGMTDIGEVLRDGTQPHAAAVHREDLLDHGGGHWVWFQPSQSLP